MIVKLNSDAYQTLTALRRIIEALPAEIGGASLGS
jgi:hypothetical protein